MNKRKEARKHENLDLATDRCSLNETKATTTKKVHCKISLKLNFFLVMMSSFPLY